MIFGLSAAVGWGLADFFGALSGRRIGGVVAVIVGQAFSASFMTVVLLATGTSLQPLGRDLWIILLNGAVTAFAYATHYHALELGPVAVVSPIGAAYAVVAVTLNIAFLGERPSAVALVGAAIAVIGVALVSTDLRKLIDGISQRAAGLPWAIAAAVAFGVAAFLLGWISDRAGWIAGLWGSRVAQVAFYAPLLAVFGRQLAGLRAGVGLWVALLAGAADVIGVVSFTAGSELGLNSIVVAASAVFPLIAVVLSIVAFDERIVGNQVAGIALVIGGLLLLGLG